MSVFKKKSLTQAETEIIENFSALEKRGRQIIAASKVAMAFFLKHGLPSRKMEDWHYTDLRTQLNRVAPYSSEADGRSVAPLIPDNIVLSTVNGKALSAPLVSPLCGASFTPLDTLTPDRKATLPQRLSAENMIAQLNTAFFHDGWKVDVFEDVSLDKIIEIQNIQNGAQSHVCFPVSAEKNSNVTVIERQIGDDQDSFLSSVSHLDLAEDARVLWIIIRRRGISSTELNQFNARLNKNACLKLYVMNIGLGLLRQEINIDLNGNHADFQLRSINLLSGKSHIDTTMTVRHLARATTSKEIMRNVVTDSACGVFQGAIRVARVAQKVNAQMVCNSLILSENAEFDAKPELEIFADDVTCGHGATVTSIDYDHLFYLMARGIPESQARSMLIKAFVSELVEELNRKEIEDLLQMNVEQWLQMHI